MPVTRHAAIEDARRSELAARLLDEWRSPHEDDPDGQFPEIHLVEGDRVFGLGRSLKLVVVWDAWSDLSHLERATIIMDAFQEAADQPEDILRVTSPLGLTRSPADQALLNSELTE